jgi:hypothetical protein
MTLPQALLAFTAFCALLAGGIIINAWIGGW